MKPTNTDYEDSASAQLPKPLVKLIDLLAEAVVQQLVNEDREQREMAEESRLD